MLISFNSHSVMLHATQFLYFNNLFSMSTCDINVFVLNFKLEIVIVEKNWILIMIELHVGHFRYEYFKYYL